MSEQSSTVQTTEPFTKKSAMHVLSDFEAKHEETMSQLNATYRQGNHGAFLLRERSIVSYDRLAKAQSEARKKSALTAFIVVSVGASVIGLVAHVAPNMSARFAESAIASMAARFGVAPLFRGFGVANDAVAARIGENMAKIFDTVVKTSEATQSVYTNRADAMINTLASQQTIVQMTSDEHTRRLQSSSSNREQFQQLIDRWSSSFLEAAKALCRS